jgi:AcrR family transcriptional regulator
MAKGEAGERDGYHHRGLRVALINAADAILRERGVEGFTLREAARRAGVSAAAPGHHFGNSAGLLTEVAILGFEELTRFLQQASTIEPAAARLRTQGIAYVGFALAHPGRFHLMFRHDLLLADDDRLKARGEAALGELEQTIRALRALPRDRPIDPASRAVLLGVWSTVHGFAHLALDGKFNRLGPDTEPSDLLTTTLPDVLLALWPDAEVT